MAMTGGPAVARARTCSVAAWPGAASVSAAVAQMAAAATTRLVRDINRVILLRLSENCRGNSAFILHFITV
jgi:hypothetical protein